MMLASGAYNGPDPEHPFVTWCWSPADDAWLVEYDNQNGSHIGASELLIFDPEFSEKYNESTHRKL